MRGFPCVVNRRLPLGCACDEEARIESADFDLRRDPVGEIRQFIERQMQALAPHDVSERDSPREKFAPVRGEPLHRRSGQRPRQQDARLFEQFADGRHVVRDDDVRRHVGHTRREVLGRGHK